MKHGSRIIAFCLIFCMMAGVLCALAVPRAMANPGDEHEDLYSEELRDYFLSLKPSQQTQIDQFFNLLTTALNDENNYVVFASMNDGDWNISVYTSANANMKVWYSYNYDTMWRGISRQAYNRDYNVNRVANLFYNGTLTFDFSSVNTDFQTYQNFWTNPAFQNYCLYPSDYTNNSSYMFTSRNIGSGNAGWSMAQNFFPGERPPEYIEFTMQSFKLGERWYLTINEQDAFSYLPGVDEYFGVWYVNFSWDTEPDSNGYPILWENIVCIPNGEYFVQGLSNVAAEGVYAYEITEYVSMFESFDVGGGQIVGYGDAGESTYSYLIGVSNSNFTISAENNGQPDSYTETYNNWYNYVNNYPTSAIVPENLGEVLYGVTGTKSYPVEVLPPASFINHSLNGSGTYFGEGYFQYHFALNNDSALNYDILDVCVTSEQDLIASLIDTKYSIRWWYDDSLTPTYKTIKDVTFMDLFQMYDIILIVSDPNEYIHDASKCFVYTGDPDLGFQYSSSELSNSYTMRGFAFVTKKALQKQLLFNFNDGITKTYDLMCQYIEKRGLWDNSFLEWTTTLFTQWQTLDGRLSENGPIYKLLLGWNLGDILSDIASKLGQIANNTSPDDPDLQPWYMSLWNFVNQFLPSDEEFAAGLDAIVDIGEELPAIPTLSPVITLPPLPGG